MSLAQGIKFFWRQITSNEGQIVRASGYVLDQYGTLYGLPRGRRFFGLLKESDKSYRGRLTAFSLGVVSGAKKQDSLFSRSAQTPEDCARDIIRELKLSTPNELCVSDSKLIPGGGIALSKNRQEPYVVITPREFGDQVVRILLKELTK